jgi:hypothetical protein
VCARLKVVHPVVAEFEWSLNIAADRGLTRHNGGIIGAMLALVPFL